jgi:opacity protein-like surface antigen
MKSFLLTCISLFAITSMAQARANDFEVALSTETAQFTFRSDSSLIGWGGADLGVGFFFNDDNSWLVDGSLMQMRQASEDAPLTFGVGVKAYAGAIDGNNYNDNVVALAIGGEVRYTIPGTMPMAVYGRGFYAPAITSFADADSVTDLTVGFQIEAMPQTIGFIGIRHLEVGLEDHNDYNADDDNIHIGVRLTF